jgi:hypothetical protein
VTEMAVSLKSLGIKSYESYEGKFHPLSRSKRLAVNELTLRSPRSARELKASRGDPQADARGRRRSIEVKSGAGAAES